MVDGYYAIVQTIVRKQPSEVTQNEIDTEYYILTNEWPAQGVNSAGDGDSVDSATALAWIFDQAQLRKSKICIDHQIWGKLI